MSNENTNEVTRRQVIRGIAAGAVVLGGAGVLAACDDGSSPSTGGTKGKAIKAGGVLRVGVSGGSAKDSIDVHKFSGDVDIARLTQLYEPLFMHGPDYGLEMVLAESVEAGDSPKEWIIRLRKDVKFHNGKPFTADDVLSSFKRIMDPADPKTGATRFVDVDLKACEKVDDHTVRIRLKNANVAFPELISDVYALMGPADFDPAAPVGTGPFVYKTFVPGERSEFVRNEDYWGDKAHLDKVIILDMPEESARINGLVSGQLDAITAVSAAQAPVIEKNPDLATLVSKGVRWTPFTMRVDVAPFDDVRVRHALRLVIDRKQMVDQALSGYGIVGNDMYAPYDSGYPDDVPQRKADIKQAKKLLAEAGKSDLTVELVASNIGVGSMEAAQVFVEQAKAAGITIKLRRVEPSALYGDEYLQWPFAMDTWGMNSFLPQVASGSVPSAPYNSTHWNDPEFNDLVKKANLELDQKKRDKLIGEALKIEWERGGNIIWSFNDQIDAHKANVKGFVPHKRGYALSYYGLKSVGFTS